MPSVLPISDGWLAVVFVVGFAVNFAVKCKLVHDVNSRLPIDHRWGYSQYMTIFHWQTFNEQHRHFYPKSKFRIISWIPALLMLPVLVEVSRRWIVHR